MPFLWVQRSRAGLRRFYQRAAVDVAVMALVLVSVALLVIEFYGGARGPALRAIELAGDVVTGIFIVELSLRWFAAPSTKAHWREFWLDWLAVIPVFRPARALRMVRLIRLFRMYRFGLLAHRFAGTFDPRQFEGSLRESLAHYSGPQAEQIQLAPDLFRALANLLDDGRVHDEARALICQALAYYITPFDVLPEEVHGDEGYLDQVYLCLWVLNRLRVELPEHVLDQAWEGEGELSELLAEELPKAEAALGEEAVGQVRRYVGLAETTGFKASQPARWTPK